MATSEKMYGYKIGEIVKLKVSVFNEIGQVIPEGTDIRLVAFAPAVRMPRPDQIDGVRVDGKQYFFNAVLASQESDFGNRIRTNFCAIEKTGKKK